jgi:hypothetical protein
MNHQERKRWCEETSKINIKINEETRKKLSE